MIKADEQDGLSLTSEMALYAQDTLLRGYDPGKVLSEAPLMTHRTHHNVFLRMGHIIIRMGNEKVYSYAGSD
jgi:hypothetical protein